MIFSNGKIAIVTPFGAEPRFDNYAEFVLARGLCKLGYAVHFYTYKLRGNPLHARNTLYKGVVTIRCRQRFGISFGLFFSLLRFRPRIVILFHPRSFLNFSAYLAARTSGARIVSEIVGILHDPYITSDRDDPIPNVLQDVRLLTQWQDLLWVPFSRKPFWQWKNFIFHMPIAKADRIVAINKDEQQYVRRFYGREADLIYWCIPKTPREEVRPPEDTYGRLPSTYLLFIGQIKKRKGWDTVVEALQILKKRGVKKNLVFVCPTKELRSAHEYIQRLGVSDQVFFLSAITNEEKNWLYAHAQYVLAPSRYEGFGLSVFEAFQARKPVLATDIPVYLEFLEHRRNAMISKTGSAEALAGNILELDGNLRLQSTLTLEGVKTADRFSEDVMLKKFLELFERV